MENRPVTLRVVGILGFMQLTGLIAPFVLLLPLVTVSQDGFNNVALAGSQIRSAVTHLYLNGAITVGISVLVFGLTRRYNSSLGVLLIVVGAIVFIIQVIDNIQILTLLDLSERLQTGGTTATSSELVVATALSSRKFAHHSELIAIDVWMFVYYSTLWRFGLIPRSIGAIAFFGAISHSVGMTLPLWFGYQTFPFLGVTMALGHVAVAGFLVATRKGDTRGSVSVDNQ